MHQYHQRKYTGFTLIELLVVIVIIGLLSTIATTSYLKAQKRARDNSRKADISAISTAVESYYSVKKTFPGLTSDPAGTATAAMQNCVNQDAQGNYFYYYFPFDTTYAGGFDPAQSKCTDPGRGYATAQFAPFPSWIPNLAEYLNPVPVDKTYQGANGSDNGAYGSVENASDASGTNKTRTYVYRHLKSGYAVYTRLENPDPSDANVYSNTTISDQPNRELGGTWSLSGGGNIYILRK